MSTSHSSAARGGLSRRGFLAGSAAVAGATTLGLASGPAAAATTSWRSGEVDVVLNADSLTVPSEIPFGVVTFNVRTTVQNGRSLLLVRLHEGVSVEDYLANLARTSSRDPAERAEAARRLAEDSDYLGGSAVSGGVSTSFTQVLTQGTYHLINFNYASASEIPPVREVRTAGPCGQIRFPGVDDLIIHRQEGDQPVFHLPSTRLKASGHHLVLNTARYGNEAVLARVRPGTTVEDMREYYAKMKSGNPPPPAESPVVSWPCGLSAISPGRSAVLRTDLPAGPYVLFSYIIDPVTGYPPAYDGMFQLVTLV
ncbi:hypothetical protein [Amycolatopsis aidingensis]|uniref:hypothetical protein n=1 Tax=Amycolatopsis aidingensis TaxID=2842453 RepID=UPI001C0D98E6|nr:hypothetical protein [Amycolatopsis aidingensis]